mgnify:CR=1 FL=1
MTSLARCMHESGVICKIARTRSCLSCMAVLPLDADDRCVMGSTVSPEEWCERFSVPGELWCVEHAAEVSADAFRSRPETRMP